MNNVLLKEENIAQQIFFTRGTKVMIDPDGRSFVCQPCVQTTSTCFKFFYGGTRLTIYQHGEVVIATPSARNFANRRV